MQFNKGPRSEGFPADAPSPKSSADAIIQRNSGTFGESPMTLGEAAIMTRKLAAEFIGTFMLVSSVCGAAPFSLPSAGLMTVAFSIGTAVLA
jgi:hypothetical protein